MERWNEGFRSAASLRQASRQRPTKIVKEGPAHAKAKSGAEFREVFTVHVLIIASACFADLLYSPLFCRSKVWQNASAPPASPGAAPTDSVPDIRALAESVRALQAQVQSLNSQVSELVRGRGASARRRNARLRSELNRATAKLVTSAWPSASTHMLR